MTDPTAVMWDPGETPPIAKRAGEAPFPFWSVMIPVYRPDEHYLQIALESVLKQDPGPLEMQIEVVDDCSPDMDVYSMVQRIAGSRVGFFRASENLGLAGCWNTCISRSRGAWVHLLHQDDLVLDGFYQALQRAESAPGVCAAFCRHAWCNEAGRVFLHSELHMTQPGAMKDLYDKLLENQQVQTPAMVVKRASYELLGGFRTDLSYVLDWEMWQRIARQGSVWFEPETLAFYRVHDGAETARIRKTVGMANDYIHFQRLVEQTCPREKRERMMEGRDHMTRLVVHDARRLLVAGEHRLALGLLMKSLKIKSRVPPARSFMSFFWLWAKLLGANCKKHVSGAGSSSSG